MKTVTKTVYFYRAAEKNNFMATIYGEYFPSFSERRNDPDVVLLKTEEMTFRFPEFNEDEIIAMRIDTLQQIRENLREEYTHTMNDYADRIRNLQMLTHQTSDYISRDDDIE